jgi:uncharacterized protein (TIGR03086 family)
VSATAIPGLAGAVLLLDAALAYTAQALDLAEDADPRTPTPCTDWLLTDLLEHMDDALDTFVEAAAGQLRPLPAPGRARLESIRTKGCSLLDTWRADAPDTVRMGDQTVPGALVAGTAALEITVHGWDLFTTLGTDRALPVHLARALLPVARLVVGPRDRGRRFAPPRQVSSDAREDQRLLAFLGRG